MNKKQIALDVYSAADKLNEAMRLATDCGCSVDIDLLGLNQIGEKYPIPQVLCCVSEIIRREDLVEQ